jgi:hypothetical protein
VLCRHRGYTAHRWLATKVGPQRRLDEDVRLKRIQLERQDEECELSAVRRQPGVLPCEVGEPNLESAVAIIPREPGCILQCEIRT